MSDPNGAAVLRTRPLLPPKKPAVWGLSLDLLDNRSTPSSTATAVVYCEANFGAVDGKTANGLVRHSEKYEILAVIDSEAAGGDAGAILGGAPNGIPVCRDLADALSGLRSVPDTFIYGIAPASGMLSTGERTIVREAMHLGMNIVSGLHEFLGDDPELAAASAADGVQILDVRRPRARRDLRVFTGEVADLPCVRIAVLGTDCANGKRTTATILTRALNAEGIKAVMIGTGQTGLMQGARYGVALDAVPSQFCAGELEAVILEAYEQEAPDAIIIEGQGALSHPAYSTSAFVLRGSCPDGVILQHAPGRRHRCDFPDMPMPSPASEIDLIETFADTIVIGMTVSSENLTATEMLAAQTLYGAELEIPIMNPMTCAPARLVQMVRTAFPQLVRSSVATP